MMELMTEEVNSGWPWVVRIWMGGRGVGCPLVFGYCGEMSLGLEEEGANRTMPWFMETLVDPRRWKFGGTDGTWSRCICWIVCYVVKVSLGRETGMRKGKRKMEKWKIKRE